MSTQRGMKSTGTFTVSVCLWGRGPAPKFLVWVKIFAKKKSRGGGDTRGILERRKNVTKANERAVNLLSRYSQHNGENVVVKRREGS